MIQNKGHAFFIIIVISNNLDEKINLTPFFYFRL
jgi:hypothetical protein